MYVEIAQTLTMIRSCVCLKHVLILIVTILVYSAIASDASDVFCSTKTDGLHCDQHVEVKSQLVWCSNSKMKRTFTCVHGCEFDPNGPHYCRTEVVEYQSKRFVDQHGKASKTYWHLPEGPTESNTGDSCAGTVFAKSRELDYHDDTNDLQLRDFPNIEGPPLNTEHGTVYGVQLRVSGKTIVEELKDEAHPLRCRADSIRLMNGPIESGERYEQGINLKEEWTTEVFGGRLDSWDVFTSTHDFHGEFFVEVEYVADGHRKAEHQNTISCAIDCARVMIFYDHNPPLGEEEQLIFGGKNGNKWHHLWDKYQPIDWQQPEFDAEKEKWLTGYGVHLYDRDPSTDKARIIPDTQLRSDFPDGPPLVGYFRTEFEVEDADCYTSMLLRFRFDDGAVVYLNGQVLWWYLMKNPIRKPPTNTTLSWKNRDVDSVRHQFIPESILLLTGRNVLAIEVHQRSVNSTDLLMDFELFAYNKCKTNETENVDGEFLCVAGMMNCPCFEERKCNDDLTCVSGICAIADPSEVGERSDVFLYLFIAALLLCGVFFAAFWWRKRHNARSFSRLDNEKEMPGESTTW